MNGRKPRIFAIVGPTASGKSEVAIRLCEELGCEIVSADSLQVYRHLDIGTAKPTPHARKGVPHHLIDIINPDEEFNAGLYRTTAARVIEELHERSAGIVLVGGTFLYVRFLLYGLVEGIESDPEVRAAVKRELAELGATALHARLASVDPATARALHHNDLVRVSRALEVFYQTGVPISELRSRHGFVETEYESRKVGLYTERSELYGKIERRAEWMVEAGLEEEVRGLLEMGYGPGLKPMQSIGYAEMTRRIEGGITAARALELIKRNTRRLGKRQMTWLRKEKDIEWHGAGDTDSVLRAAEGFFGGTGSRETP